jgi:peroxiredoxin
LPPGSPAPAFALADLEGRIVSLDQYRGRNVLLTFFSPSCGFCQQMAPDLADLCRKADPAVVVIGSGDADAMRKLVAEQEITCPVLMQDGSDLAGRYQVGGTPMGYLITPDGKIGSPIAVGAAPLLALASGPASDSDVSNGQPHTYRGNKPLTESHILRTGLTPGATAPDFRLPTVNGGTLTLSQFRGRRVLLLFSAPDCDPCNQLAPDLPRIQAELPELQLVMIARGDAAANRAKAMQHGFTFPVGLQKRWEVSRDYGIFATPVAFLIDENGRVLEKVATGVDEIVGLARGAGRGSKEAMPIRT